MSLVLTNFNDFDSLGEVKRSFLLKSIGFYKVSGTFDFWREEAKVKGVCANQKMSMVLANLNDFDAQGCFLLYFQWWEQCFRNLTFPTQMSEIDGNRAGWKMSLVLCNFNGFAKTIKKHKDQWHFWQIEKSPRMMENVWIEKCHWSLLISMISTF